MVASPDDQSVNTSPGAGHASAGPGPVIGLALIRQVRAVVLGGLAGGALLVAIGIALPSQYTAKASFIPDAGQAAGFLGGLVGQFVGLQADRLAPRLAGDLVRGDPILVQALYEQFGRDVGSGGQSIRLLDYVGGRDADSARAELRALRRLKKAVAVDVNERTGVVDVYATLRDPVLAAAVANRLVQFVDVFNTRTRQSRAGALRRFLEERTAATELELRRAESALQTFYTVNRRVQDSPRLSFEEARLRREIDLRQQVYLSLTQQLDQARVDEVKDTPVLTWVAAATVPVKRSFPRFRVLAVVGALLGAGLVAIGVSLLAYLSWYREVNPTGYGRLRDAAAPLLRRALGGPG